MVATSIYLIVFRIVHIMAGVVWGGSVFMFVVFVQPTAAAIGPLAGPFMQELLGRRKVINAVLGVAAFTIVGGGFLYWHDWQGFGSFGDWVGSGFGLGITIGAVSSIVAFLIGLFGTKPGVDRLMSLGRTAAQGEGAPSPELAREIQELQARLKVLARLNLAFVAVAVLAMATARYW
jgi:hypothetical protein